MATMLDGESYLGSVLIRPLSESGDIKIYLWPMRCLKNKIGGPTFGVDVNGEEVIRYDPHGLRGHWHKGGYDKLGAGGSHTEYPDDVRDVEGQLTWSLDHVRDHGAELLAEAGFPEAAKNLDLDKLSAASQDIRSHLKDQGDLFTVAVDQGLINV